MAVDFKIENKRNDFVIKNGNLVTTNGDEEILQRVKTRLYRIYGEWFLNQDVGIPWYAGVLGSKNLKAVTFLIKTEALATDGVRAVIKSNSILDKTTRKVITYLQIQLNSGAIYELNLEKDNA